MNQTVSLAGKAFHPLGLGCWVFDTQLWSGQGEEALFDTMQAALRQGIDHFDTATGYGNGSSERVIGRFLARPGRREQVFLASKADIAETAQDMLDNIRHSLERLQTETIDLYYIHWPDRSRDMRPTMAGLEMARQRGWIGAVGVSNFSPEQMEQVSQAGKIDVHQLGYNLFWRFRERDVIAYCREHGIPLITYSSLAQGILTGKFPRQLNLPRGDARNDIIFFQPNIWPHVYQAVEQLKGLAAEIGRPLQHLAIRWTLAQPGIVCALVGARNPAQVNENAAAMQGEIPAGVFERMTAISDELMRQLPDTGDMYHTVP
jgi:aryl-alcohol dehydrogenase-like predicted oxidoreductase